MSGATLTPRQQRFVEEYLTDLNATQAAIRAGYAESGARQEGSRLLANADIADSIALAQTERGARIGIDQDWVLRRLRSISDRCLQAAPVLDRKGERVVIENDDGEIVPAFVFDASGANRATELLGKHLGMFTDRVQNLGKDGQPVDPQPVIVQFVNAEDGKPK